MMQPGSGLSHLRQDLQTAIFHRGINFPGVPAHWCHTTAQSEHYKHCWPNEWVGEGDRTGAEGDPEIIMAQALHA